MRGDGFDDAAFEAVVESYAQRLAGMCWRYVHDAHLVEDIVQETFARLFEARASIDETFNAGAWLHRVAANLCRDELRRRKRHGDFQEVDEQDAADALAAIVDADRAGRPADAFDLDTTREMIRAAAEQLPQRQRTVFVLRDVRGLSEADAAAQLGLSPGAVQGTLFRARERFRATYAVAAGLNDRPAECAMVEITLEHAAVRHLRQDRLDVVRRHVDACDACRERFEDPAAAA